jgi:hypothetical protein
MVTTIADPLVDSCYAVIEDFFLVPGNLIYIPSHHGQYWCMGGRGLLLGFRRQLHQVEADPSLIKD